MSGLPPSVLDWFARHHGLIAAQRLDGFGVGRQTRRRLVVEGLLVPVARGVFRIATAPVTLEARCLTACLAHPGGFVTGPACGRLYGLRSMPPDHRIHFCTPHGLELDDRGFVLRQSTKVDAIDIRERPDGIRVARPVRLAFDLAADLSADALASVIEQLLDRRWCSEASLGAVARRLARPARPGSRRFVETLARRLPGGPLQSGGEVALASALVARGVPIEAQHRLLPAGDGSIRVDLAVPTIRWGVEIDLHPSHLLLAGVTADKRRDRRCHMIDWQIERVTELDFLDVDGCADELTDLYRARLTHFMPPSEGVVVGPQPLHPRIDAGSVRFQGSQAGRVAS